MADEPTFDVFVSYSHDDEAWARRLFAELEDRALSYSSTVDVPPVEGSAQDAVKAGIVGSRVPVVLWSPAAQQSEMVSREVELLGDRPRLVLSLGLGPETPWGIAIADPVAPETYEQGPDALAPDKWKCTAGSAWQELSVNSRSRSSSSSRSAAATAPSCTVATGS